MRALAIVLGARYRLKLCPTYRASLVSVGVANLSTSSSDSSSMPRGLADRWWPYFYVLVAAALCWAVGPLDVPLVADNQHYFFIAERFASGVPPHVSHFDPKNALSMMLSGAAIALGRVVDIPDIYSARAASIAATTACFGLLWTVARRYGRSRAVAHVSVLAALTFNQFIIMGVVGARPKVFLVLFILCVLMAVQARKPILTGVSAAAAFLCWQPALLFAGLAPVAIVFWRRPVRSLAYFALGFLVLVGIYETYFIYHGALYEQIEQAYRFPAEYMSGVEAKYGPMKMRLQWITKSKGGADLYSSIPMAGLLFTVLSGLWSLARPRRAWALLRDRPEWGFFVCASAACLVFLHLDYQGFPDRFIVEPFLVIGFAMIACAPLSGASASSLRRRVGYGSTAVVMVMLVIGISRLKFAEYRGPVLPKQIAVAEQVSKFFDEGLSVWAVGCTHVLALGRHDNWVPYGFFFRGTERYLTHRFGAPYVPLRDGELPDVVLLSRGKLDGLARWLPRFYKRGNDRELRTHAIAYWTKREVPLEETPQISYRALRAPIPKDEGPDGDAESF